MPREIWNLVNVLPSENNSEVPQKGKLCTFLAATGDVIVTPKEGGWTFT
jgi:hypothetical protein